MRFMPRGYFTKRALPYWIMVALDCFIIAFSLETAVYILYDSMEMVYSTWSNMRMVVMSMPIMLMVMHLFRTYGGTLAFSPLRNLMRLAMALCSGGFLFWLMTIVLPKSMINHTLTATTVILTLVLTLVLQWCVRLVARTIFKNQEGKNASEVLFNKFSKGSVNDTSIRANKKINLCLAHMSEDGIEQKYVKEAFDTNWVVPLGPNVNAFEKDLENFVNDVDSSAATSNEQVDKRVVALSAGTAAIHLALRSLGVVPGDEVIVQSFTFCASANPVTYVGAIPVFVDSEPQTWNMDPVLLEEAIKDRKEKTGNYPKAIIPVALYGMPYDVDGIMAVADKYQIPVVEDAAEGFGSRWRGRILGSFGKFGILSFNGNKMITTSGGGALICDNDEDRNNVMWFATQAREAYPYYQHEAIGYNYRMSNVCAGIGRGQMTVANDHIAHHKRVQALYKELLADVPGVHLHEAPVHKDDTANAKVYDANYWLCAITLDENVRVKGQENAYKKVVQGAVGGAAGVVHATDSATTDCQPNDNVEAMRVYLDQAQIEARPVWKPMHKQPVYAEAPAYVNGVSESIFKVGLCLPAGPCVTEENVRYIVKCIKEAIVK